MVVVILLGLEVWKRPIIEMKQKKKKNKIIITRKTQDVYYTDYWVYTYMCSPQYRVNSCLNEKKKIVFLKNALGNFIFTFNSSDTIV